MKKGVLQSFEAVIAILMITTTYIIVYTAAVETPEFETITWKLRGFAALKSLDDSNSLRDVVVTNSTDTLKERLSLLIPANLNYEVYICKKYCGKPDLGIEKLVSVTYLVAGDIDDFQPRQIVLYLW